MHDRYRFNKQILKLLVCLKRSTGPMGQLVCHTIICTLLVELYLYCPLMLPVTLGWSMISAVCYAHGHRLSTIWIQLLQRAGIVFQHCMQCLYFALHVERFGHPFGQIGCAHLSIKWWIWRSHISSSSTGGMRKRILASRVVVSGICGTCAQGTWARHTSLFRLRISSVQLWQHDWMCTNAYATSQYG